MAKSGLDRGDLVPTGRISEIVENLSQSSTCEDNMSSAFFEFPTQEEWERIYKASPFEKLYSKLDDFGSHYAESNDIFTSLEIKGYVYELVQRLADTSKSYNMMMFYYEKGIPDQHWRISPGSRGESIQYFPDFEKHHFYLKAWFDFYSDTLYYKLFSAWDIVGHILNVKYSLDVHKVDFSKAVQALKHKDEELFKRLIELTESTSYQQAKKIRNDIVHNYLPNVPGMAVFRTARFDALGVKKYVPSNEIVANIKDALDLFEKTMQCLTGDQ